MPLLPRRNTLCVDATAIVAAGLLTVSAFAHPAARTPAPQDALQRAHTVLQWVREWNVTEPAPPCDAVAIILRLDGHIIAQATATHDPQRNLALAARTAILRAGRRLPTDRDALWEQKIQNILVSVELAGQMVPITVRNETDLATAFSPGIDGVAVRLGEKVAMRFPSQMLPAGEDGLRAARALISEIASDPVRGLAPIEELIEAGYIFYRFRTTHLAQVEPSLAPVFIHRGGRIIPQTQINTATLMQLADGMAAHLLRRQWPGVEPFGIMGTYNPITARPESTSADPTTQALVISALSQYASMDRVSPERASQAQHAAQELLTKLAHVAEAERAPWTLSADAAATIIALTDVHPQLDPNDSALQGLLDKCAARLALAFEPSTGQFAPDVPLQAFGMVALAYVRLADEKTAIISRAAASACVRAAFRSTPADQLLLQMPYLAWADTELAGSGNTPPSAPALIELRRQTWKNQLTYDALEPADWDFAGSIVIIGTQATLPNWHSIRPLPWLASMLADPHLTEGNLIQGQAPAQLHHTLALARFAAQLAAGPEATHMYSHPDRALHGVRAALWDQRMPTDATAIALDGICRLVIAADALSARQQTEHQNPTPDP